ncbi:MAG: hypothetical protein ABIT08_10830 [Bacteroidia bacterium]
MSKENIRIVNYRAEYADIFRELNLHWIKKYFEVEPEDLKMLTTPQLYIIDA